MSDDAPPPIGSARKKDRKRKSTVSEKRFAATYGAERVIGSGCLPGRKGDLKIDEFLLDLKTTNGEYTVRRTDLVKITKEAREANRKPGLIIELEGPIVDPFFPQHWIVFPFHIYREMMERCGYESGKPDTTGDQ